MGVKVTIVKYEDGGEKEVQEEKNYPKCDSFGIGPAGDLVLVTTQDVQGPPGTPVQRIGSNQIGFAAGTWLTVEVEQSNIQVATPPPGINVTRQ